MDDRDKQPARAASSVNHDSPESQWAHDDTALAGYHDEPRSDARSDKSASHETQEFAPGDEIAHFTILGMLGKGGMGVVLSAYDPDLDRKVAIKLLRRGAFGSGTRADEHERFLREARAMAKLSHPNVLTVHQVGTQDGRAFIAMEYAPGGTLTEWCAAREHSWQDIVDVFARAGRGLAAAHDAGLVHRDFKPDNVLLTRDGDVRVADFGIVGINAAPVQDSATQSPPGPAEESASPDESAKSDHATEHAIRARGGTLDPEVPLTVAGALMGTPAFMAPEQHNYERVDARADQFAFCVALYQALYGYAPFSGKTYWLLVKSVCEGEITVPEDTRVPSWVRDVILRGLATDPDDRYPSMHALLAALTRDPALARRRRWTVAGLGLAFAVLTAVAIAGFATRGTTQPRCHGAGERLHGIWDEPRKQALHDAFLATKRPYAEQLFQVIARRLDDYGEHWVAMHRDVCEATYVHNRQSEQLFDHRMRCLDQRLDRLSAWVSTFTTYVDADVLDQGSDVTDMLSPLSDCEDIEALIAAFPLPADPQKRAEIAQLDKLMIRGETLRRSAKYREAFDLLLPAMDRVRALGYPKLNGEAAYLLANMYDDTSDFNVSQRLLREALLAAAEARDDNLAARAWTLLIWTLTRHEQYREAGALELTARVSLKRAGATPMLRVGFLRSMAALMQKTGKLDAARSYWMRALAIVEQDVDNPYGHTAGMLNNLATVSLEMGDYQASRTYLERALPIWERTLGAEHPHVAKLLNNLGNAMGKLGDFENAHAHYQRSLDIREKLLGPDALDLAFPLNSLGEVALARGQYQQANEYYEASNALFEKHLGPEHPILGMPLNNLGDVAHAQGDDQNALSLYQRALVLFEGGHGEDHPDLAYPLTGMGNAYMGLGRPNDALPPLERALRLREASQGEPAELALTRFSLARALWDTGREHERARVLAEQALSAYRGSDAAHDEPRTQVTAWLQTHASP